MHSFKTKLPRHPKPIIHPCKSTTEPIIIQRHKHLASFTQSTHNTIDHIIAMLVGKLDKQRQRRGELEGVLHVTINRHDLKRSTYIRSGHGNLPFRACYPRSIASNGHDVGSWNCLDVEVQGGFGVAFEHEEGGDGCCS
ncbi:hypothetical protein AO1008_00485 [Aspergillus oryzae 100-8]|uniref:Uncharacterized protein n=1 Tax=Aspergillus oryzae (strain 3.042) TaxID=1160506 RepID=I7ZRN5_ASPO3|nr:hypothetical protein Ao3042_09444 [Aspergillus oryzae 3.042]KDE85129.1 hypothetical protein AO1008_00485 [Aspergillus oryzae 100-8]|eukprot:EIT74527.1 hypothetical protein Ao3042_09444 [Aspergillus oryzae 3.042]